MIIYLLLLTNLTVRNWQNQTKKRIRGFLTYLYFLYLYVTHRRGTKLAKISSIHVVSLVAWSNDWHDRKASWNLEGYTTILGHNMQDRYPLCTVDCKMWLTVTMQCSNIIVCSVHSVHTSHLDVPNYVPF